ncbi:amidohydrolase [uncultured Pseudoflavonifractor sp.]|uniref:amidohydrolase n=1 Tax=uncultured Pseudoflavonifractor sp. TaxID=1221379 RepID=UPI0025D3FB3F|nr:amidohydrolase [uncultured Pseudoflavonifractor sp.]
MEQTLFYNGTILTMEDGPAPQAVLTEGGVIRAVGTLAELEALASDARRRDLKGRTLMPAFLDPHSHLTALASTLDLCPLGSASSFGDMARLLLAFQKERHMAPDQWLIGFGYDHNVLSERAQPDRHTLDDAFPETPVLVSNASGHMGAVNSAALKLLNITAHTPDPEGGKIGREADGRTPSGYLEENAFIRLASAMPGPSPEQAARNVERAEEIYLSHGITLIQDGLTDTGRYALLSAARLKTEAVGYADLKNTPELIDRPHIGGYKIFLDGSPQGRTAWMLEPYASNAPDQPDYCGYPIYTDEEVTGFVRTALTQGRQLLAHCNGDAAAAQYIRCCRAAQEETGRAVADIRPVMIHAQLVRREQLAEMKELGIIPSFFAAHLWYWGDVHAENFGPDRAASISPLGWAEELGIPFTLHQDTPVIQPDMLETVWCAVNRLTREGKTLGPTLKVSPMAALRAVTIHAAYQYFREDSLGSITPGKQADLIILSAAPTAVDPMDIRSIRVLETIHGGKTVWQA